MKIKFPICGSRFTILKKSGRAVSPLTADGAHGVTRPTALNRRSSSGIALVITLILLAVTLVMALAFLAISRRESGSVVTAADTATARLAADAALANAEAQVISGILSTTNPYNFGLVVSTNFLPPFVNPPNPSPADLTNLQYSPRPPVFITNELTGVTDFRFYLDLNRNGRFDTNGVVGNFDANNNLLGTVTQVGDPEWIGVLEHPDAPHGPNNKFISRYAFIALPVGNSLDLNAIHNQTRNAVPPNMSSGDGYFRNEGVGSWEMNLAAFLADLNTNQWDTNTSPYSYQQWTVPAFQNTGAPFADAFSLLSYRYNYNYNTLAVPPLYFYNALENVGVDGYSLGNLMTTTALPLVNPPGNGVNAPWAGSDNTNRFFTPSDLFDPTKTSGSSTIVGFTNRLLNAGAGNSTYDRYTFYRLLSQLGTDTTPESGKLNLNYRNVTNGVIVPGMETNFYPWSALEFFTNAADRMLREYTANWLNSNFAAFTNTFGASTTNAFGITNIPVYVNGQFVYTPAVNRLLQLAANIYDATVSNRTNGSPDYPDVFRPLFSHYGTNVYISGYTNLVSSGGLNTVSGQADLQLSTPFDVAAISVLNGPVSPYVNIYGVPWIIGAKKGFPNFNEFSMENNLAVTRRLQLTRTTNASPFVAPIITSTNQMYTMSLTSSLGVELWNSYAAAYPGTILLDVNETNSLTITNDDPGFNSHPGISEPISFSTNVLYPPITGWPGSAPWLAGNPNPYSFVDSLFTGSTLTNSVYRSPYATGSTVPPGLTAPCLIPTNYFAITIPPSSLLFESNSPNGFHFPQFGIVMTNRLQVFMLDLTNGVYHVIDYVHFAGPNSAYNLNQYLADNDAINNYVGVWDTNYPVGSVAPTGPTYGILNQIAISKNGSPPQEDGLWQTDPEAVPLGGTPAQQQKFFQAFFLPGNHSGTTTNLQLSVDAPYAPTRYICQYLTWQANDPLVHYLASDIDEPTPNNLTIPKPGVNASSASAQTFAPLTSLNLGQMNDRYTPWGGNPHLAAEGQAMQSDTNAFDTAERDPLASSSDSWDFPTNKFPTTGWIGRVHRGTPWQTVYLKASGIDPNTWSSWTGNGNIFDATNSVPTQDWLLFDIFTTAFNDNATRGQLSVNVGAGSSDPAAGLAAWSAALSGIALPPTGPTNTFTVIAPVGNEAVSDSPLGILVTNINNTRANFVNADGLQGSFEHVGDILAVPQLTEQSPFLNLANTNYNTDEMYEWLPQQTMSLLRVGTPRYVIYSYGQTLKPAPGAVLTGGNFFGMVTNYQIVSEAATRAVVRIESTVTNINGTLTVTNNHAVIESFNVLPPD